MISIIETKLGRKCNTNNHFEYFPAKITDRIELDRVWFEGLHSKTQDKLRSFLKRFDLVEMSYPHDNYKKLTEEQRLRWYNIYHCYLHQYDYSMYAHFYKKDFIKIPIKKQDLLILRDICKVRISKNPSESWLDEQFSDLSDELKNGVAKALNYYENECFIKTEKSSAKNEVKLEPKYTLNDVLLHLTSCKEYFKEYDYILENYRFSYEQNIIIMKWREDFNREREFRVIILDGKVKGISQQLWYKKIEFPDKELIKISNAIIFYFKKHGFYVKDITIDLIIDNDYNVELIECNPGGLYSSSGSSLFHWIDDLEKLYDGTNVVYAMKLS